MDTSKIESQMDPAKAKQGKLLAKAIKKANTPSACFHNQKYWAKVAYDLASEPNIATEFVPVREWVKCMQDGNLNIALKLCGDVKKHTEIQTRANWLVRELIKTYPYSDNVHAYMEEIDHLLKVLDALNLVFFYHEQGGEKVVKRYLYGEIKKNVELNTKSKKEAIDLANSISLIPSDQDVEDIFHSLKKIIPVRQNYVRFSNRLPSVYDGEALVLKFPIDAVLNKKGEIIVWKTLGLDEGSFSRFLKFKKMLYEDDSKQWHEMLDKVLTLKSKGYDLEKVVEKITKKYPKADLKDITEIYNHSEEQISQAEHTTDKLHEDVVKVMGESL